MRYVWLGMGCALMSACSGKTIDVGPPDPHFPTAAGTGATSGTGGTGGTDTPTPPTWPEPDGCVAASNASIVGTWKGYVETVGDPWDELLLVIHGAIEGGAVCGTLRVGNGVPPPPATDPDASYPPGLMRSYEYSRPILPGFAYTLLGGRLREGRLQFGISADEPWRGWCALQTPIADELNSGRYGCVRNWATVIDGSFCHQENPRTGERVSISCARLWQCGSCLCDANQCWARGDPTETFDVHVSGAEADGSGVVHLPGGVLVGRGEGARPRFFRSE